MRELTMEMVDDLISYICPDCVRGFVFKNYGWEKCPSCKGKYMSKENKERRERCN